MSSIGTTLLNSLRSIERPSDFCVGGIREIFMPTIDIDGRIAFPILRVQAERLAAIAEAAPYGRGEETVVDREVRRTWPVDSAKVRIGGRHWDKTLAGLVADIALGLGVSEPVAAEFYRAPRKIAVFLNLCESNYRIRIRGCGYDGSIRFF